MGLENLSAIPGTIGATPVQNVGAYGVEVADLISGVSAVHLETGEVKEFTPEECLFGYRDSFFKRPAGRAWIITDVTFKLLKSPKPILNYPDLKTLTAEGEVSLKEVRTTIQNIRSKKFQIGTR